MLNSPEENQFEEKMCKNISQTKEKNSSELFEEKIIQSGDFLKKIGKGCEEKNHGASCQENLLKIEWTQAEENILIQKHCEIGNKWASISQFLDGKNDNCVKNHFYSKLRKMIRKLNRIIQVYCKKSFKSIPNATIYKLVEASEQRFKQKPICTYEVSMGSQDVISKMLKISAEENLHSEENGPVDRAKLDEYKELIEQINRANKNYKKKSKKIKNSTIKAPIRTKKNSRNTKKQSMQFDGDCSADQSESELQKEHQFIVKPDKSAPKFQNDIEIEDEYKETKVQKDNKQKKVEIKEGDEMQELLKNIGLLQEGKKPRKSTDQKSELGSQSIKSFSDFEQPSEGLSFFDDSNNCWKKESRMFTRMNRRLFGGSGSEIEGL